MKRKLLRIGVLALTCVLVFNAVKALSERTDSQTTHQYLAGPDGTIVHLFYDGKLKSMGLVPGGFGGEQRKYLPRVSELRVSTSLEDPGELENFNNLAVEGNPIRNGEEFFMSGINDMALSSEGELLLLLGITRDGGEARTMGTSSLNLPTPVNEQQTEPLRSQLDGQHIDTVYPIVNFARNGEYTVTPFGAVSVENEKPRYHEWAPDLAGRFTKWRDARDVTEHKYSRYRPPFEFDRIDRRGIVRSDGKQHPRWSPATFLYCQQETPVGIYWSGVIKEDRRRGKPETWRHVFGQFKLGGEVLAKVTVVDSDGKVLECDGLSVTSDELPTQSVFYFHGTAEQSDQWPLTTLPELKTLCL